MSGYSFPRHVSEKDARSAGVVYQPLKENPYDLRDEHRRQKASTQRPKPKK